MQSRQEYFTKLFPNEKSFRWKQIEQALFAYPEKSWHDLTMIAPDMRETLSENLSWNTLTAKRIRSNPTKDTYKAALKTHEGHLLEAVLMRNPRGHWTLCLSCQIGCAMNCSFCATGRMGFVRDLTEDEFVDQYRFWVQFLREKPDVQGDITNIVIMGMGEPMANYETVRDGLGKILHFTKIGETRVTVSSVGVLDRLTKLLDDPLWPSVRIAISLHSADPMIRQNIVPTSYEKFLDRLADWSRQYLKRFGNRRHHLTFEHILLQGVNDGVEDAKKLADFVRSIDVRAVRVNLIPYNETNRNAYKTSENDSAEKFLQALLQKGVLATIRRSKGLDIAAACGQLATEEKSV